MTVLQVFHPAAAIPSLHLGRGEAALIDAARSARGDAAQSAVRCALEFPRRRRAGAAVAYVPGRDGRAVEGGDAGSLQLQNNDASTLLMIPVCPYVNLVQF